MLRAHGYAQIIDPDRPLFERDTIACSHCGKTVFVKPGSATTVYLIQRPNGSWFEEPGAFCRLCMRPVCLPCCDADHCLPLDRWLEFVEARAHG
jgi:hypothetical protein